ncbi:MAG: beta-1,6-N-acetylglucosaminyltransferase [Bacteroidota bacterium]
MHNSIAILILAHHNAEQLSLLIERLRTDFDIFVQIDKKSTLEINSLPKGENVFYFKEISVYWGHFTQIQNMKFLLEQAYSKTNYSHYCFISGDDLPIKSNLFIKDFLLQNRDKIFMYANPLPINTWGFNKGYDRLDRYWFMKINHRKTAKVLGRLTLLFQRFFGIKLKRYQIDYYAGSNWVNLSADSVDYLFRFLNENPSYLKKLKYSRATDEIWIQSVLANSELKTKIVNYDLRYIDWTSGPDFPRTLTMEDFEKIQKSDALFGRKFSLQKDPKLVERLLKK